MALIEKDNNILGYSCFERPDEHRFRYDIRQKKWEKIIIKTKIILHYTQDPCEESIYDTPIFGDEIEEGIINVLQESESLSDLTEIKGIGAKRALELERAGVKTISDLAKCSPQQLAEETSIPITQISNWIIEANKLTKRTIEISL